MQSVVAVRMRPRSAGFRSNLRTLGKAVELMGVGRATFVPLTVLGVVATVSGLLSFVLLIPLIHQLLGDQVVSEGSPRFGRSLEWIGEGIAASAVPAALFLAAILTRAVTSYRANLTLARISAAAETRLGEVVLRAHLRFGQQHYDTTSLGAHVKRINALPAHGVKTLQFIDRSLTASLSFALYLVALVWLSLPLSTLALFLLAIYFYSFDKLTQRVDGLTELEDNCDESRGAIVHELLQNLPLVRVLGTAPQEVEGYVEASRKSAQVRLHKQRLLDVVDRVGDVLNGAVLLGFVIVAAAMLTAGGEIVVSLVFFLVFRRAMQRFSGMLNIPSNLQRIAQRLETMFAALADTGKFVVPEGERPFRGLQRSMSVKDLDFAYKRGRKVLRAASCEIAANRTTFVVGATGSGKSTLFKLWLRLYDCPPGTVFFDDVDLRDIDTRSLLRCVSYCGSQPYLFNDTIRVNVTYGLGDVTDRDLWQAAERAQAREFIESLDAGFDEKIGDQGAQLSTGEGQRLALMRVFLRRPDVLLLDEATSALDAATDADILNAISALSIRTVVIIAHRLAMIPSDGSVVVLRNGRVVEQGTRERLITRDGEFARLWRGLEQKEHRTVAVSVDRAQTKR